MTLANILTIARILIVVPFVGLFFISAPWSGWAAGILYWIACLTDYFDGVIARKTNQISALGKFLDPIADKILVAAALIMLAGTGKISHFSLIPAIVIVARELFVSGLREHLIETKKKVSVSVLAKWKTAIQMLSLSILLIENPLCVRSLVQPIGIILLWISGFLSVLTAYLYWANSTDYLDQ